MFLNEWVGGERQEAFQLGEGKLRNEESRWLTCLPALTDWAGGAGVPEGGGGRGTPRAGTPLRLREGAGLQGASRREGAGLRGAPGAGRGGGVVPELRLAACALAGGDDGYVGAPCAPPRT